MKTIYKYTLPILGNTISIPMFAKLLKIACQEDRVCAWFEVDTNFPDNMYKYKIYGTGHLMPGGYTGEYLDSAFDSINGLVWHIYKD